ncbi:MAG: zinc ribbon domain-containing protein [Candidatus Zipacnadales bacterium]
MGKAYGGTIANPKELETLEKEIESLERIKDRLENELLELFDKVDAQKRAVEEQEAIVESLRSTLAETEATFARETARLTAEITRLNEERTQISNCVAAESLQIYERIRERAANVAVAVVQGRTCSACHVNLPIVRINRLQTGSDFEKCESCMRLLWIANEAEADVEDSSSTAD